MFFIDLYRWKQIEKCLRKKSPLSLAELEKNFGKQAAAYICQQEEEKEREIRRLICRQEEMTDYVAKWTHEAKLPLAALKLINERNKDREAAGEMRSSIARLESLLHTMLLGSKLHRPEHDIRYEKLFLRDAVGEALRNQSYFLIKHGFEIQEETGELQVYGDKRWLVYLLDQLIQNAVKYRGERPVLRFWGTEKEGDGSCLVIEDNGIGIAPGDLPYIFQKGFVGKNHRKGDYHSTGMGLYFVKEIGELLHLEIRVSSEPGQGSRFELWFRSLEEHFLYP